MLVRSRNKQILLDMERYAIQAEKNNHAVKITAANADGIYLLGEYPNMEFAIRALNALQEAYLKHKTLEMWIEQGVRIDREMMKDGMVFQML